MRRSDAPTRKYVARISAVMCSLTGVMHPPPRDQWTAPAQRCSRAGGIIAIQHGPAVCRRKRAETHKKPPAVQAATQDPKIVKSVRWSGLCPLAVHRFVNCNPDIERSLVVASYPFFTLFGLVGVLCSLSRRTGMLPRPDSTLTESTSATTFYVSSILAGAMRYALPPWKHCTGVQGWFRGSTLP
jgi:hypothetical protein